MSFWRSFTKGAVDGLASGKGMLTGGASQALGDRMAEERQKKQQPGFYGRLKQGQPEMSDFRGTAPAPSLQPIQREDDDPHAYDPYRRDSISTGRSRY